MKTVLFLSLTLAACRLYCQNNPAWRHLPPDAAAIYHLNLAALTTKLPLDVLTAPIPEAQHHTSNREFVTILRDPTHAGVDLGRDLFIIESGDSRGDSGKTISILFLLKDTARWTAFLRKQQPGMILHSLQGDTCYAGHEVMGTAWDDHYAVLTYVSHLPHPPATGETRRLAIRRSFAILYGYDDSTAIHNPLFRAGFSDEADIHAYTSYGLLLSTLLPQLGRQVPAGNPPGLHTLSTLRFEKGRVLLTSIISHSPGAGFHYDSSFIVALLNQPPSADATPAALFTVSASLPPDAPVTASTPPGSAVTDSTSTPPSPPISGTIECKALARSLPDYPFVNIFDKLTFTIGHLNTAGEIENRFELTLSDDRENSLRYIFNTIINR